MIRLEDVTKTYGMGDARVDAVSGVNLSIRDNEFISLIGPSGSGKSTLMNIMGCLDVPTTGRYYFEGKDVGEMSSNKLAEIRNEKIGFVFQSFNLLPYATAFENVEMPLVFKGVPSRSRRERAMELLETVGLVKRSRHKPGEMSGGEIQRVAIARSLANDPRLILADEPTGNLDTKSGDEIIALFESLWKQGRTVIMVTHNPAVAERTGRVIRVRDGRIDGWNSGLSNGEAPSD